MARPDRLEDLGKISYIIENLYDSDLLEPADLSLDEFIDLYYDQHKLEDLYNNFVRINKKILHIYSLVQGEDE